MHRRLPARSVPPTVSLGHPLGSTPVPVPVSVPVLALVLTLSLSLSRCSSDVVDLTDTGPILYHPDAGTMDVPTDLGAPVDTALVPDAGIGTDVPTSPCGICASPDQVCCPTLRVCFVPGLQACPTTHDDAGADDAPGDALDDGSSEASRDVTPDDAPDDAPDASAFDAHDDAPRDAAEDVHADVHDDAPRDAAHEDVPDPCLGRCTGITACCPSTRACFIPSFSTCRGYDAGVNRCPGMFCSGFTLCCPTTGRCVPRGCITCCR